MPNLRSLGWALVVSPALLVVAGCENNENRIDTRGATTSPDAVSSTDDALKRGEPPAKKVAPAGYPGASGR